MNTDYRYALEKGSKTYRCPNCGKKSLKRYIDSETGNYLPEQYGRCNHENNCNPHYHLNPYLDGYVKLIQGLEQGGTLKMPNDWKPQRKSIKPHPTPEPVFFDFETFRQTLEPGRYGKNTFIQNLLYRVQFPFEIDEVTKVIQLYRLGTITNGYRAGANTFPFIDINGNLRAIQVKQFDEKNHTTSTDFLHSIIEKHLTRNSEVLPEWLEAYKKQDKLVSCLFGEHLLGKYPLNPIALVEAPKTAIYTTLYFGLPEQPKNLIWLAVYNKSSFSLDKMKVLQGRDIFTFPDLSKDGNTFSEWQTKAKEIENRLPGTKFIFSDLLEQLVPEQEKSEGNDLADYLIKLDWRLFRKQDIQEIQIPEDKKSAASEVSEEQKIKIFSHIQSIPKFENIKNTTNYLLNMESSKNWGEEIIELERFFSSVSLPPSPIQLAKFKIVDIASYLQNSFACLKRNNANQLYRPMLNRLKELKLLLDNS